MISVQFLEDVGLVFTGYYHTNPPHKAISLHTQLMLSFVVRLQRFINVVRPTLFGVTIHFARTLSFLVADPIAEEVMGNASICEMLKTDHEVVLWEMTCPLAGIP